jgi:hypothetical protein
MTGRRTHICTSSFCKARPIPRRKPVGAALQGSPDNRGRLAIDNIRGGTKRYRCCAIVVKAQEPSGGFASRRPGERQPDGEASSVLSGDRLRREIDAQRLRDACAVGGIGLGAVGDMTLFDFDARVTHSAGSVLEQQPLLLGAHLPEQDAGLLVVIISDAGVTSAAARARRVPASAAEREP